MSSAAPSATKAAQAAKVKREKQILIVSAVVLLALLGFQLPKIMGGKKSADQGAVTTEVIAGVVPATTSPLAAAGGALPDTDRVTVQVGSGQLISFGLFKSKDPFMPQLSTNPVAQAAPAPTTPGAGTETTPVSPAAPSSTTPKKTAPNGALVPVTTAATPISPSPSQPSTTPVTGGSTTPVSTPPASTTPSSTTPTGTTTTPTVAPTSVSITTNGNCEVVALNGTFPGSEDIFKVVSIAKDGKSARIGIVGGAYDNGQATTALQLGKKVTLVNTADGTRYVIELVGKCAAPSATAQSAGTGTSPTSTSGSTGMPGGTVAAPTVPTSTSTTPIVTDLLDTLSPVGK